MARPSKLPMVISTDSFRRCCTVATAMLRLDGTTRDWKTPPMTPWWAGRTSSVSRDMICSTATTSPDGLLTGTAQISPCPTLASRLPPPDDMFRKLYSLSKFSKSSSPCFRTMTVSRTAREKPTACFRRALKGTEIFRPRTSARCVGPDAPAITDQACCRSSSIT